MCLLLMSLSMVINVESCMPSFIKSNTVNYVNDICTVCTNGECANIKAVCRLILCNDESCNKEALKGIHVYSYIYLVTEPVMLRWVWKLAFVQH